MLALIGKRYIKKLFGDLEISCTETDEFVKWIPTPVISTPEHLVCYPAVGGMWVFSPKSGPSRYVEICFAHKLGLKLLDLKLRGKRQWMF